MLGRVLLLGVAALVIGGRAEAATGCKLNTLAELPVTMSGFSPTIKTKINGQDATFIVDSGAFYSTISPAAAARLGLKVGPAPAGFYVRGVGGRSDAGVTNVKVFNLAGANLRNLDFLTAGESFGDAAGLLGQNILGILDVEYDFANSVIRLFKPEGCGDAAMAYWAGDKPFSVARFGATTPLNPHINAGATVNDQNIRVILDTGAYRSVLSLKTAARAGVTPQSPGTLAGGQTSGIGRRTVESWIGAFDSFGFGGEKIANTRLRIGDVGLEEADMLLGADFFMSHRVFVSNSQHKVYFTYNGGPVFKFDRTQARAAAEPSPSSSSPPPAPATEDPTAPTDAAGFTRRAAALTTRGEFAKAIDDLSRAVELEPANPQAWFDRALAQLRIGRPLLAMADLDKALALKPDHVQALLVRGRLYLANKDEKRGRADLEEAIRLSPKDEDVHLTVGGVYLNARLFEAAIGQYDQWIAANPKSTRMPGVLNQRCWARATWGKELDKALGDCDRALKLQPRTSNILDSRGLVKLRLGQVDAAIADYDAALALQPKVAWSLYGRGLARLKKGMTAEGDADIKSAVAIAPRIADEAKSFGVAP
jgi:tetratricopeptide (TPR) repeat protein/predicted aspartyl protease